MKKAIISSAFFLMTFINAFAVDLIEFKSSRGLVILKDAIILYDKFEKEKILVFTSYDADLKEIASLKIPVESFNWKKSGGMYFNPKPNEGIFELFVGFKGENKSVNYVIDSKLSIVKKTERQPLSLPVSPYLPNAYILSTSHLYLNDNFLLIHANNNPPGSYKLYNLSESSDSSLLDLKLENKTPYISNAFIRKNDGHIFITGNYCENSSYKKGLLADKSEVPDYDGFFIAEMDYKTNKTIHVITSGYYENFECSSCETGSITLKKKEPVVFRFTKMTEKDGNIEFWGEAFTEYETTFTSTNAGRTQFNDSKSLIGRSIFSVKINADKLLNKKLHLLLSKESIETSKKSDELSYSTCTYPLMTPMIMKEYWAQALRENVNITEPINTKTTQFLYYLNDKEFYYYNDDIIIYNIEKNEYKVIPFNIENKEKRRIGNEFFIFNVGGIFYTFFQETAFNKYYLVKIG